MYRAKYWREFMEKLTRMWVILKTWLILYTAWQVTRSNLARFWKKNKYRCSINANLRGQKHPSIDSTQANPLRIPSYYFISLCRSQSTPADERGGWTKWDDSKNMLASTNTSPLRVTATAELNSFSPPPFPDTFFQWLENLGYYEHNMTKSVRKARLKKTDKQNKEKITGRISKSFPEEIKRSRELCAKNNR